MSALYSTQSRVPRHPTIFYHAMRLLSHRDGGSKIFLYVAPVTCPGARFVHRQVNTVYIGCTIIKVNSSHGNEFNCLAKCGLREGRVSRDQIMGEYELICTIAYGKLIFIVLEACFFLPIVDCGCGNSCMWYWHGIWMMDDFGGLWIAWVLLVHGLWVLEFSFNVLIL